MSTIEITVAHDLPQEEAIRLAQGILGGVEKKHGKKISILHEEWRGNAGKFRFSVAGLPVSGTITVSGTVVKIVSRRLLFGLLPSKGKITEYIFAEAMQIFTKTER